MGRGGEALLLLRECEKLMSANSRRDAAPWISHLGNFISFWRVTSFLRAKSDRYEIPWVAILATVATFGASCLHLM